MTMKETQGQTDYVQSEYNLRFLLLGKRKSFDQLLVSSSLIIHSTTGQNQEFSFLSLMFSYRNLSCHSKITYDIEREVKTEREEI